jgi:hypothetical protein
MTKKNLLIGVLLLSGLYDSSPSFGGNPPPILCTDPRCTTIMTSMCNLTSKGNIILTQPCQYTNNTTYHFEECAASCDGGGISVSWKSTTGAAPKK